MDKKLLSEMSWPEIEECVKAGYTAVLPVGSVEQHGRHLPVNIDYFLCEQVVQAAAGEVEKVLVLPTVKYGISSHHLPYSGTMALRTETYVNLIKDLLYSLTRHGFRKVFIVNGHGGNRGPLATAISAFLEDDEVDHPLIFSGNYYSFAREKISELRETGKGGMAHAGEYETSLALYLESRLVEMDKAEKRVPCSPIPEYIYADLLGDSPHSLSVSWREEKKEVWEYSFCDSGVAGDPTAASREKGEKIFNYVVEEMVDYLQQVTEV